MAFRKPFKDTNFESAFKKVFAPEKGMTNLNLTNTYQKGKLAWQAHPEWEDGKVYNGLTQEPGAAVYLYRTISADGPQSLTLYLGSDDAIKAWFNGKQVVSNFVTRGALADQDKATVQLKKGDNKLLIKIVNNSGECGFYFKTSGDAPENILAIVQVEESKRTDAQ